MPSVVVTITPHTGVRDGVECDLGIDAIWVTGPEWPVAKRVGYVGRDHGAIPSIVVPLSASDQAAVVAAVTARGGSAEVSKVEPVPHNTPKR